MISLAEELRSFITFIAPSHGQFDPLCRLRRPHVKEYLKVFFMMTIVILIVFLASMVYIFLMQETLWTSHKVPLFGKVVVCLSSVPESLWLWETSVIFLLIYFLLDLNYVTKKLLPWFLKRIFCVLNCTFFSWYYTVQCTRFIFLS